MTALPATMAEVDGEVVRLARDEKMRPREIAARLNVTVYAVYDVIRAARGRGIHIPKFSRGGAQGVARPSVPIPPDLAQALGVAGLARGLTREELGARLLQVIVDDDLIDAVLDDGGVPDALGKVGTGFPPEGIGGEKP